MGLIIPVHIYMNNSLLAYAENSVGSVPKYDFQDQMLTLAKGAEAPLQAQSVALLNNTEITVSYVGNKENLGIVAQINLGSAISVGLFRVRLRKANGNEERFFFLPQYQVSQAFVLARGGFETIGLQNLTGVTVGAFLLTKTEQELIPVDF